MSMAPALTCARRRVLALAGLALAALLPGGRARADDAVEIRIATLAPKGSSWAKEMEKGAHEIETRTQGRVKVKYFFSAQQGDEHDVIRKMKLGQLDGAALTAIGLGIIDGNLRVNDLPMLYDNEAQVDYVRDHMAADLDAVIRKDGYVWLGWGDVGWAFVYSNTPITSRADLKQVKMWVWTDDPSMRALWGRLGVNAVPLNLPDVYPQLQTGLIDGCYGSPLAAVAFQWFTKVKYATAMPVAYTIGALVVRAEVFDRLSPADQKVVREVGKTMGDALVKSARRDNDRARKVMEKAGVQFTPMPDAFVADLRTEGAGVWQDLVKQGVLRQDLLDVVMKYVAEAKKK